jgi:septum site-determining protein MinC
MSTTKNPGAQSNPEADSGTNGDMHASAKPALPLPVKVDAAKMENGIADHSVVDRGVVDRGVVDQSGNEHGQRDESVAVPVLNGVNGVHADETSYEADPKVASHDGDSEEKERVATPDMVDDASGEAVEDAPVQGPSPSPTADLRTLRSAVKIKGRPGGVSLELGEGEWDELMLLLQERLNAAEGFFRGGRVLLDVDSRALGEDQLIEVRDILEAHEMQLAVVRSTAEGTLQAAAEVGIATTVEEMQEALQVEEPPLIVPDGPPNAYTPSPYAPPEVATNRPNHFVHRGSLRSGQVLRKTESIVVIGDVNPGAQVISGGDIMVWGRLRGIAHAGAEGNRRSVVAAIDFVPTQLRIANLTAIAPEARKAASKGLFFWKKEPERRPEIARVIDGKIVVEPWDEGGKPNGLGIWRK